MTLWEQEYEQEWKPSAPTFQVDLYEKDERYGNVYFASRNFETMAEAERFIAYKISEGFHAE